MSKDNKKRGKKQCPRCHGTGKMPNDKKNRKRTGSAEADAQFIKCDLCGGSGKIPR